MLIMVQSRLEILSLDFCQYYLLLDYRRVSLALFLADIAK